MLPWWPWSLTESPPVAQSRGESSMSSSSQIDAMQPTHVKITGHRQLWRHYQHLQMSKVITWPCTQRVHLQTRFSLLPHTFTNSVSTCRFILKAFYLYSYFVTFTLKCHLETVSGNGKFIGYVKNADSRASWKKLNPIKRIRSHNMDLAMQNTRFQATEERYDVTYFNFHCIWNPCCPGMYRLKYTKP
jgi:hypothetical protein